MKQFASYSRSLPWLLALLMSALLAACGGGQDPILGNADVSNPTTKAITAYSLAGVSATINEANKTIGVTLPTGTNVSALVATFTTTGAVVKVGPTTQTSGTTANNFTGPVAYTVTAADGSVATYTVTATVAPSTAKAMTAYSVAGVSGTINETTKTIALILPSGTNVTARAATFTTTGANVKVGAITQTSGTTVNNFTAPVAYTVTAADGSVATYTVAVTVASNAAKALVGYSLAGNSATINEANKTIAVTLPTGTNVSALVATFTTTGFDVKVGATTQTSGTTPNNFSTPVTYTVAAADGSTTTYAATATVAQNTAKAIAAYSLDGIAGTINEAAKTIAVTLPFGTSVSALTASFTTTGAGVKVGPTTQVSGVTRNNFSNPVTYTVTAADGSTTAYAVTATVAQNTAKAITAYSLDGISGTINEATRTIAVGMPSGTNVTALIASFATTGAGVKVGATTQVSGATANNFTTPLTYTVTAADSSTTSYNVAVSVGAGPAAVNLGTAGNFVILSKAGISTTGTTAIVGDIGVSPIDATAITGFPMTPDSSNQFSTSPLVTGKIYAANYATPTPSMLTTAISDMELAFTNAAGRPTPNFTELGAGNISGLTLVPGLYKWGTGVLITSAGVTLSGGANDVWIFQIGQNLTVNNSAMVTLIGGAQAKNIFWQVAGQATLGTAANFQGNILSQTLISLNTGAVLNGRALAQTAVTLNASSVTKPAP